MQMKLKPGLADIKFPFFEEAQKPGINRYIDKVFFI